MVAVRNFKSGGRMASPGDDRSLLNVLGDKSNEKGGKGKREREREREERRGVGGGERERERLGI